MIELVGLSVVNTSELLEEGLLVGFVLDGVVVVYEMLLAVLLDGFKDIFLHILPNYSVVSTLKSFITFVKP